MKDMMRNAEDDYRRFARKELAKLMAMYDSYDRNGVSANVLEEKPSFLGTNEVLELVEGVINKGIEIFGSYDGKTKEIFQKEFNEIIDRITRVNMEKAMDAIARSDDEERFDAFTVRRD